MAKRVKIQLGRLPKLPSRRSLNFKGNIKGLIHPAVGFGPFKRDEVLDPYHSSLAGLPPRATPKLPYYADPTQAFVVRIVPDGILKHRELPSGRAAARDMLKAERSPHPRTLKRCEERTQTDVSWVTVVGANIHKSAVVRTTIAHRMKAAVALLVTRGAAPKVLPRDPSDPQPKPPLESKQNVDKKKFYKGSVTIQPAKLAKNIEFIDEDASGEKWIMEGWTYVFFAKLPLLRMPYPELVHAMRQALQNLKRGAEKLQKQWDAHPSAQARMAERTELDHLIQDGGSTQPGPQSVPATTDFEPKARNHRLPLSRPALLDPSKAEDVSQDKPEATDLGESVVEVQIAARDAFLQHAFRVREAPIDLENTEHIHSVQLGVRAVDAGRTTGGPRDTIIDQAVNKSDMKTKESSGSSQPWSRSSSSSESRTLHGGHDLSKNASSGFADTATPEAPDTAPSHYSHGDGEPQSTLDDQKADTNGGDGLDLDKDTTNKINKHLVQSAAARLFQRDDIVPMIQIPAAQQRMIAAMSKPPRRPFFKKKP